MSEQDFFFDEEPQPASDEPKPAKASKPAKDAAPAASAPAKRPVKDAAPAEAIEPSADAQMTTWSVAALLAIVGLLVGAILGFMLGGALAKPAAVSSTGTPTTGAPVAAPSNLTTDQIEAGLPAGHPPIDSIESTETTGK